MASVFQSIAAHFAHQQPGTEVETMGDKLGVKLCKPMWNYHIVTTRWIKSTRYQNFPVILPYKNMTFWKYQIVIYSTKAQK